ncbi:MAG: alpha-amylase family glycosyl hydrolase [Sandaracinus sp.]
MLTSCAASPPARPDLSDWRDRVIYEIVTDRFANGDPENDTVDGIGPDPSDLSRWQGGDWRGITEHLDYLERLGVSAIWISPIVRNVPRLPVADGYHGYWAADFTELEPRFGTLEELQQLVASAHARDIAVIVDVVPNHAGRVFDYDLDRDGVADPEEAEPPFADTPYDVPLLFSFHPSLFDAEGTPFALTAEHFHRRGRGDLGISVQRRYGDFPDGLRDLDTENDTVVEALVSTYAHWAEVTDVDGFRIDAVPHVDEPFWPRFAAGIRARMHAIGKDDFYLLGEIFDQDDVIARYTAPEGSIDAGFDIPFWEDVISAVVLGGAPPSSAEPTLSMARAQFRATGQPGGVSLSPWQARAAIVDSHDLVRVRSGTDPFAADQAIVLMFTVDAIPCVYYGTEAELTGNGPPASRERLWDTGYREDLPTFALLRRLASLRRAHPALRRGELVVRALSTVGGTELDTTASDAGALVFERSDGSDRVLVAVSTHPTRGAALTVPSGYAGGTTLIDALGGATTVTVLRDGSVPLAIAPRQSLVLVAR